ncbi:hypothetical protein NB311A_20726 [Nitrobacter sp. Nb-311A]|uniref:hypothetical protein n=1 Tax=Nitrobacter sp. Nb-311A TaxID=314253 RepID=UPI0000687A2F|nr:hypothetical protein [Nitrobacter sp. Nb-311A]EAQ36401.1 hypothetical protein NB311A_20726 [Nitrobacter sp. Nb-311A]
MAARMNRPQRLMTVFIALSLTVTMSLGQLNSFERGSFQYWLLVTPALLFPLLDPHVLLKTLFGRAKLLLVMVLWAGSWYFVIGDIRVIIQLGGFVLVLAWISTDQATLDVQDLVRLYVLLILVGVSIKFLSDLNHYGLIPGYSDPVYGRMRVSFFPNVAYTGLLSLGMLMVLTSSKQRAKRHPIVLAVAVYFLVFSFVRAALIAALIYLALHHFFSKYRRPRPVRLFWIAIIVGFGFNLAIFSSAPILYLLQDNQVISTFLLRGQTNLSISDILYSLYRPWLWNAHLHLFFSSPGWMGWGSSYQAIFEASEKPLATNGSESLPTRLLATYGLAGILFTLYLVGRLRVSAFRDDRWACASFPAILILMMNWGSVFHPTDGMFVLLMLMITRGSAGFMERSQISRSPTVL